jgi:hypothetical protein
MAYNYNSLVQQCDAKLRQTDDPALRADWDSRRGNARRMRNTYLWYDLLFYFYGILDAVVDAHLHDFDRKMRLEPDLSPDGGGTAGLQLKLAF